MFRPLSLIIAIIVSLVGVKGNVRAQDSEARTRETIVKAALSADSQEQVDLVKSLAVGGGKTAIDLISLWKDSELYIYQDAAGQRVPVILSSVKDASGKQQILQVKDNQPVKDASGAPIFVDSNALEFPDSASPLRKALSAALELSALADPDPKLRLKAVDKMGLEQNLAKLDTLRTRLALEVDKKVLFALRRAIALTQLRSPEPATQIEACKTLGELDAIPAQDALKTVVSEATKTNQPAVAAAANAALAQIASHIKTVNTVGTMFRGLSTGSILLVAAIGLAITFGLMGVINMAHGELMVVGAYTTYVVQHIFGSGLALSPFGVSINLPGLGLTGSAYDAYFIAAIPLSFLMAALVGIGLERSIIQFLYRRPLESLLATWGVSLILQQLFRLTFGANNVQVDRPAWLAGAWTVNDIDFLWNRVFVIGLAIFIILAIWLALNKTSLGQLIRAVMQNRNMAACMGVRTERVNMLTFGLGSGLAGLAGAFLAQLGNVGPSLGQSYIVDSFMTVVVGGVGNLIGTVVSALGIGTVDQSLQQILGNPVLGKILVLFGIILFLQWRPAGIFVTRSRSLES